MQYFVLKILFFKLYEVVGLQALQICEERRDAG